MTERANEMKVRKRESNDTSAMVLLGNALSQASFNDPIKNAGQSLYLDIKHFDNLSISFSSVSSSKILRNLFFQIHK